MDFKPGSAVEVTTDSGDSWHSATIVRRVSSDRFLLHFNNFVWRTVVSLHQLRPPLPHRKFDSVIENPIWSFKNSEDMAFVHHNLINQIRVISGNDMISELPDIVLLHILNFMDTKSTIRTCVLSKRWNNLCKRLANLAFPCRPSQVFKKRIETFKKFASWVLSNRDESYSVMKLSIHDWSDPEFLDKVIEYALIRDVQNLAVRLGSRFGSCLKSLALVFHCQTLTSLKLYNSVIILPKSLHLPALKSLHLEQVEFTGDCVEPFSNCSVLDTLVLGDFSLHNDAKFLCISNSTLSRFTLLSSSTLSRLTLLSSSTLSRLTIFGNQAYKIVLSTPNLGSCTISDTVGHELFSNCNLSFLREVNINTSWNVDGSIIMGWLQVLANVKILTLSKSAFLRMLRGLSKSLPTRPKLQPPSFARLETLNVRKRLSLTNEKINTLVECLLQNSPMARIDVTVLK